MGSVRTLKNVGGKMKMVSKTKLIRFVPHRIYSLHGILPGSSILRITWKDYLLSKVGLSGDSG